MPLLILAQYAGKTPKVVSVPMSALRRNYRLHNQRLYRIPPGPTVDDNGRTILRSFHTHELAPPEGTFNTLFVFGLAGSQYAEKAADPFRTKSDVKIVNTNYPGVIGVAPLNAPSVANAPRATKQEVSDRLKERTPKKSAPKKARK